MKTYSYRLNGNYYVELDVLNQKLEELSHGAHQWLAIPVPGIFLSPGQQPRSCVLVGYSNPDGKSLPNFLIYLFPAVALAGHSESEPRLVIRLDAGSMPALSRGLYWDEGTVKFDPMEDFFRVWFPLKRCLGLQESVDDVGEQDPEHYPCGENVQPAHDVACREALKTHLIWLTQCTEVIQEAVSEDIDSEAFFERLSSIFRRRRQSGE